MPTIDWNQRASLMRVTTFATAEPQEELVEQDTVRALVAKTLTLPADAQDGLLIRSATADDVAEYDVDAIRELAARPDFTDAGGADDLAEETGDAGLETTEDRDEETIIDDRTSGPAHTDALGRDGEK